MVFVLLRWGLDLKVRHDNLDLQTSIFMAPTDAVPDRRLKIIKSFFA